MDKTTIKPTNGFTARLVLTLAVLLTSLPALAQTNNVSGTVTDQDGEPVAGVTVMIPGTTQGTSTATDGSYILNVGNATELEYNCLGYKTQKANVGGRAIIDVTLEEDRTSLDEIVVVGYGVQKRRDIIGAVETFNTKDAANRFGSSMSMSHALQGVVPGLTLTFNDGKPSRESNIRIRSVENSIGSGGSALVLLDGVETSLDYVNPNDIESVTVLKDASSTAVYGARGTFGVILLTSKTPEKGRVRITYDGSFTMYQNSYKFQYITEPVEWVNAYIEAYTNAQGNSNPSDFNSQYTFTWEWYDELIDRRTNPNNPNRNNIYGLSSDGQQYYYFADTDWYNLVYKKIWYGHSHTLTASMASDIGSLYVSGRIFSQDSMYKMYDEKFNQYNVTAKGTINVKPWFHISEHLDLVYRTSDEPYAQFPRILGVMLFPFIPPQNEDGTWTPAAAGYGITSDDKAWLNNWTTEAHSKTEVKIDFIKDVLWASADFSWRYLNHNYSKGNTYIEEWTGPNSFMYYPDAVGKMEQTKDFTQNLAGNVIVNYVPRLGQNHNLAIMAGWNIENEMYDSTYLWRTGWMDTTSGYNNWAFLEGDDTVISDNGSYEWGSVGAFYRISYNYKNKYLIETSGRYDGISKFPANQRWGFFPSGSIGWRINEEGFMRGADWLDNLKIRFSIGSAGNGQLADAYAYLSTIGFSSSSKTSGGSTFKYTTAPDPVPEGLTWEAALTYDLGIDFEAFNGRLNFTGDIYRKNTNNMYVSGPELPAVYGNDSPKGNYADMRTDGYELSVGWRDSYRVGNHPLSYFVKAMFWDYTSKITRYTSKTGTLPYMYDHTAYYYEGMTLGEIWGYECNGLYQSDEEAQQYNLSNFAVRAVVYQAGDAKFEDQNGDMIINRGSNTIDDHGDLIKIGNTSPRYQYSFQAGINWNGIGVSFLFQGVGKRDWYPAKETDYFWGKYCRPYNFYFPWFRDRWSEDNRDAYWPRLVGEMATGGNLVMPNSRYLQDASYIRLKNVTVEYTFPTKIVSKMGLQELKVYFNCENPFCWSPMQKHAKNFDPEGLYPGDADLGTNQTGEGGYGDGEGYPIQKSFTFGLSITL